MTDITTTPSGLVPGIHLDFPVDAYFVDPCAAPSLTQSVAKLLIDRSPAHAFIAHPRLNPGREPNDPKKYDVGNIAHALLLGRGKSLVVIEGDDWVADRKAKAEAREAAHLEGKLAVLSRDMAIGEAMAIAAFKQLQERGYGVDWLPDAGDAEAVIAWQEGPTWFRAMIDWLSRDHRRVWDYKTTSASAAPQALDWRMSDGGWDVQAAMHERGLDLLDPENAGRRQHFFVVQEAAEPYALTVMQMGEAALTIGRKRLAYAVALWERCMASGAWPGYPLDTHRATHPGSAENRWLERELAEAESPPRRGGMITSMMGG